MPIAEIPNEACGMFSTQAGVELIDYFHPMRNTKVSPAVFALDGQQMLELERDVEDAGRVLIGVMHSHTETTAYPSPTGRARQRRVRPVRHVSSGDCVAAPCRAGFAMFHDRR